MVYNKIDALENPEDSENSENSDYSEYSEKSIFISAAKKINIDTLRNHLYQEVSRIHAIRYPYNNFLY